MYAIFIYSSVDGHLGCLHILANVNSAATNIGVHVSFGIMVFSGYMPRSGIAGLQGSFIPSFLRNLLTVLHSGCTRFTFLPIMQEGSLFSTPSPTYVVCRFFLMVILTGVR